MIAPLVMKRRLFFTVLSSALLCGSLALAQGLSDGVVAQLREQGFDQILVETTLLGRTRIVATRSDGTREIILNPQTGEILRDLWQARVGSKGGKVKIPNVVDRDDSGDDDSGRDDSDDNSGSGSHSSGDNEDRDDKSRDDSDKRDSDDSRDDNEDRNDD